jgi:hypothetical protein
MWDLWSSSLTENNWHYTFNEDPWFRLYFMQTQLALFREHFIHRLNWGEWVSVFFMVLFLKYPTTMVMHALCDSDTKSEAWTVLVYKESSHNQSISPSVTLPLFSLFVLSVNFPPLEIEMHSKLNKKLEPCWFTKVSCLCSSHL